MAHIPSPDVRPLIERPDLFRHEVTRTPKALAFFWISAAVTIAGIVFGIVAYEWLDGISDMSRSRRGRSLELFPFIVAFIALITMFVYGKRALIGDDVFTWVATGERMREHLRYSAKGTPEQAQALSAALATRDPRIFAPLGRANAGLVGGRILTAPGARVAVATAGYLHRRPDQQQTFAPTLFEGPAYARLMMASTKALTQTGLSKGMMRLIDESFAAEAAAGQPGQSAGPASGMAVGPQS